MAVSKRLVAAGVATFLIGMVCMFPARIAYDWFVPSELRLTGISGSLWSGHAAEGSAAGLYLRNVQWRFKPLTLLTGKAGISLSSDTGGGFVNGDVSVSPTGTVTLQDFSGSLSLETFSHLFQLQGFQGLLSFTFNTLAMQDGFPTEAQGEVELRNLLAPQLSPLAIGDYRARFASDAGGIVGTVEDLAGVLEVTGTINVGDDRSYSFVGDVAARPQAPEGLVSQLRFLGSPDASGRRQFRIEGRL